MRDILKKVWMTTAVFIITAAVVSGVFRALTPWISQYKAQVERHLSYLLGQPVTVQKMQTSWYWFEPVLRLEHLTIKDDKDPIHVEKLLLGINLFKSLIHWRIQPGLLYVDGVQLSLSEEQGRWRFAGLNVDLIKKSTNVIDLLAAISQQEHLLLNHLSVRVHLKDGSILPFDQLKLSIMNHYGTYKIKGRATLKQTKSTSFQILGTLNFDPFNSKATKGTIYFSIKDILPMQWQSLFFKETSPIQGGLADLKAWFDFKAGTLATAQAQVLLNHIAWHDPINNNDQLVQSLYANLAWSPDSKGWKLQGDHVQLRVGETTWPENKIMVQYNQEQNSFLLYIKTIVIDSLIKNKLLPYQGFLQLKPQGQLSDVQVGVKAGQLNYFLARFYQLSWGEQGKLPEVNNLSGALHWEPQEGHLELDSNNTLVAIKGYPKQQLNVLNGSIDWKELSTGLRLSIDRFVLSQPELTISAEGMIDEVSKSSLGAIHLNADFSAKNIQQWIPYLPKERLKPKLVLWLNKDLKKIAEATGKITLHGLAKDFPFDNHNGEFSIVSHARGGELHFTSKWQLVTNLEGYIRVKNRNLEIDIVNGDFQGVPVKQMNLRIDDIGNDRETLFLHGIVNGQAQKMLNFVLASPLKEKLSKLKMLTLKGLMLLNLRIEVPLYPENDTNLVQGDVTLKDNKALIKHQAGDFSVDEISGALSFNEQGVTHSALTASILGYPINIKVESTDLPKPATTVSLEAQCTVESLKNKFDSSLWSLFKGGLSLRALFKITADPNDFDNMVLVTDLKGLAINLPEPLGKRYNQVAPLRINLDINPKKAFRLRADYNKRLSTDTLFELNDKGTFVLKSGQIKLGAMTAVDQKNDGLTLAGSLEGFDLWQWKNIVDRYSSDESRSTMLNKLKNIDLTMNRLTVFSQQFNNLSIKGAMLPSKDWNLTIHQKKVEADLTYHQSSNLLSGLVSHLHLDKVPNKDKMPAEKIQIKVTQFPNLNLRIDDLSLGNTAIGTLTLKSHTLSDQVVLDYCRVDSPVYQLTGEGAWLQQGGRNKSTVHFKMNMSNLSKALERWGFTPAVDANKGYIEFEGGWPGAFWGATLQSLKGRVYLQLKNGRITHLSPETEEKLGLGKLLSILSLQTIPRRLKLDFSDLAHEGYSFDIFKGNFTLDKGIMKTQDSYLDGPVAYASMKGDLDIVGKMYDLNLHISPHITASLPVVATIAGGPIAGFAAWVASKIINQSMQKITGYSYKISGPWEQPVVQQLSIIKKIIEKVQ